MRALRAGVVAAGRVVLDSTGAPIDRAPPSTTEPAVLLVSRITDAVKMVENGFITGSLKRDSLWAVHGFVLTAEVVDSLPDGPMTPGELLRSVEGLGFSWAPIPATSSSL